MRHSKPQAVHRPPLFERLLGLANDVGLFSEEYDVGAGRLVGNFPQAFTHLQLIKTACLLSSGGECDARLRPGLEPGQVRPAFVRRELAGDAP